MRHLHKLGATAFDDLYTVIGVSAYLLSILLKSVSTDPKELAEGIGVSLRTAQRYVYNSHRGSTPCLSSIYRCLKYIDIPLGSFFQEVEYFKDNRIHIALYDLKHKKIIHYTEDEYQSLKHDEDALKQTIRDRKVIVEKCGMTFVRPYLPEIDNEISKFPSHMIKGK